MADKIIKGRLISAGRIVTVDNHPAEFADDLNFETVDGLLIAMPREAVATAAGTMFGKEIEVRLHGLQDADVNLTNAALKYRDARRAYDVATAAVDEANRGQGNSDGATVSLILAACDAREKAGDKMDEARDDLLAAAEALP
mgnify:CR=1 FL=1